MKTMHGKKSVRGAEGAVYSEIVDCITCSETAVKLNIERLTSLNCSNLENAKLYTCLNESPIEHGFGFLSSGHSSRSMVDYAINQRKAKADMLQRYTNTGFSQPHQYRKRYLEMPNEKKLSHKEVETLLKDINKHIVGTKHYTIVSAESLSNDTNMDTVRAAISIAKAQPRRTNRAKWKEEAGYRPQTLAESDVRNIFVKNDVVCYTTLAGDHQLLIIASNVPKQIFSKRQALGGHVLEHLKKRKYTILSDRISVLEQYIARDLSGDYFVCSSRPTKTNNVTLSEDFLESLPLSLYCSIA